jgi:hypothetical protein
MSVVSVGDPGVYGRYGFVQLSLIVPATIGQAVQQLELEEAHLWCEVPVPRLGSSRFSPHSD